MRTGQCASRTLLLVLLLLLITPAAGVAASASTSEPDTLQFEPVERYAQEPPEEDFHPSEYRPPAVRRWLNVPFHDHLLESRHSLRKRFDLLIDYNRVDLVRVGMQLQAQARSTYSPRFAGRAEYATGRGQWLYGAQLEQPLDAGNHVALGAAMLRATNHLDLNQVEDFENSLALLFGRTDSRDYFEREGAEAYVAARWPGVTIASLHIRDDKYRSLPDVDVWSMFYQDRELRPNPPIADGELRALALRFERHARQRGGLYHWIELEMAGSDLGGDFQYRRALADLRSVIRLSPAMGLHLRAVGGATLSGELPPQRIFTIGGMDGMRGYSLGSFRGNQVALGQLEYVVGIGRVKRGNLSGLHAIAFTDAGTAWNDPSHEWRVDEQRFALDGGFGLSTAEDNLRVYFARNLRDPDAEFVVSARLQRPF